MITLNVRCIDFVCMAFCKVISYRVLYIIFACRACDGVDNSNSFSLYDFQMRNVHLNLCCCCYYYYCPSHNDLTPFLEDGRI